MLLTHLFEAGIRTAAIDLAARKALLQTLPVIADRVIAQACRALGFSDADDIPSGDRYDQIENYYRDGGDRDALSLEFAREISEVLTRVAREHAQTVFDPIIKAKPHQRAYRQHAFNPKNIIVQLDPRELSTDAYAKRYGGYFQQGHADGTLIKVFLDRHLFDHSVWAFVQEKILGEQMEDGVSDLLGAVMPTFVHEYAHWEQSMRKGNPAPSRTGSKKPNPNGHSIDFGYITVGRQGSNRVGKRGGVLRTTDTPEEDLRYLGNVKEIDSWASGAASELVHEVLMDATRGQWSSADINRTIVDVKQNMAGGYSDAKSFNRYFDKLYRTFNGEFDHLGLKREQMVKVWRRFAKIVVQKLDDYQEQNRGKAFNDRLPLNGEYVERRNPEKVDAAKYANFRRIADEQPFAETVKRVARITAREYVYDPERYMDPEEFLKSYGVYNACYDGMQFLRSYYFPHSYDEPAVEKLREIFERMFKRYVSIFAQQKRERDAERDRYAA